MLHTMEGPEGPFVFIKDTEFCAAVSGIPGENPRPRRSWNKVVCDGINPPKANVKSVSGAKNAFALIAKTRKGFFAARDRLGIKPLYYGSSVNGENYFSSEVKAISSHVRRVKEFPPGHFMDHRLKLRPFTERKKEKLSFDHPEDIARELRKRIRTAVLESVSGGLTGSWLSGGLDSSIIASILVKELGNLKTFAGGIEGSSDIENAAMLANFLGTDHHEVIITKDDLVQALPATIETLESFDALLVRSSVLNYLVSKEAGQYIDVSFSGEGGDELFAGYDYLKKIPEEELEEELEDITGRMHNTSLQRVDRCARAGGLTVHVPFLHEDVVRLALSIPGRFKLRRVGNRTIEKWILRLAMDGKLPPPLLWRPKEKFWEGSGVGMILKDYAESQVSEKDFRNGRVLPNGIVLASREEFFYWRIFRERLGEIGNLDWVGRTTTA